MDWDSRFTLGEKGSRHPAYLLVRDVSSWGIHGIQTHSGRLRPYVSNAFPRVDFSSSRLSSQSTRDIISLAPVELWLIAWWVHHKSGPGEKEQENTRAIVRNLRFTTRAICTTQCKSIDGRQAGKILSCRLTLYSSEGGMSIHLYFDV